MMFEDAVYVGRECPFCGEYHEVLVSEADFVNWQGGELAQVAFPYLSGDEREILISGICSACWDKMFPSEEDEEEDIQELLEAGVHIVNDVPMMPPAVM